MKINWKVRFKNPLFLFQIFLSIVTPVGAYFGITGMDVTTWPGLFKITMDALSNPFILFSIGVSVFNAINDPVVSGLSDSRQSLRYIRPKDGGQ